MNSTFKLVKADVQSGNTAEKPSKTENEKKKEKNKRKKKRKRKRKRKRKTQKMKTEMEMKIAADKKKKKKKKRKKKKLTAVVKQNLFSHKQPAAVIAAPLIKHQIREDSVELLNVKDIEIEHLHCKNTSLQGKLNYIQHLLKMAVEFIKDN
ncbi:hypothetical protein EMPG_10936 [Blastomyces silverae]|uniref:Uncharacterized protein n=1 Tax=Blastomyces silverae TaxID=2060906 RepID=A0A0H1B2F3_9EURO|nr:hypothetical protein EMPG_10936 [Blastomyces silverae]